MFTWTYKKLITLRVFPNNKIVFFLTHPTCTIFPFLKCRLFSGDSVECNMGVPVTRHISKLKAEYFISAESKGGGIRVYVYLIFAGMII